MKNRVNFSRFAAPACRALAFALVAAFVFPTAADAQYFGRNKVQWETFDFNVLRTEHFDIYYYGERDPVIDDAARMAERWYDRLSRAFDHNLSERKPIVFYKNHPDFQQTTTTGGMIGEGTGGFTDFFRNRVVMPITGTYADTDHVIGHELVHVFQFDLERSLQRNRSAGGAGGRLQQLPLWMIEGLAEYLSQGRVDPPTALWIRDSLLHGTLPDVRRMSFDPRYSPYQFGQAFWAFVAGRWGDRAATQLFVAAVALGVEGGFRRVLDMSPDELFAAWHREIEATYQPVVQARLDPETQGRAVLTNRTTRSRMNIAPVVSPDGTKVAFLSTRDLFTIDLYLADAVTGSVLRHLVKTASTPHFDSLRFIDSAGTWSPDGSRFAFVVIERGDNRLAIVDVESRQIERRVAIPGIPALSNPAWSPDGRTIAFSGSVEGLTDIFTWNVETGEVTRLTSDAFGDLQPTWSPDGRTIAFISDRTPGTDLHALHYEPMSVWTIDVASRAVRQVPLFEGATHVNPQYSPDGGSLYFISDADGTQQIYRYTFASNQLSRITNVATGVAGITSLSPAMSVAARSGRLMYSVLDEGNYNVYGSQPEQVPGTLVASRKADQSPAGILPPVRPTTTETVVASYLRSPERGLLPRGVEFATRGYRPSLSLEYLGPPTIGVGADRYGFGVGGAVNATFGDILGQHRLGVLIQTQSSGGSNFANQIGGQLYYLNQQRRVNWGGIYTHIPYVSAGRTTSRPVIVDVGGTPVRGDVVEQVRLIVTVDEATALSYYPLGRTRRFELNGGATRYGYDAEVESVLVVGNRVVDRNISTIEAAPSLNLVRGAAAFVGDSSYFGFISPVAGTRYRLEAETYGGDLSFQTALADYRRYEFFRPLTLAFRGLHYGRYGSDSESGALSPLFIGYETLVRGYDYGSFRAEECVRIEGGSTCPVYTRLIGSKIAVMSVESRLPLFGVENYGIFRTSFLPTEIAAFFDGGVAWSEDESPTLKWERDSLERIPVFSAGVAVRMLLGGYLPLHFYYAVPFQRPEENGVFGFTIAPGW
jgi:Tol biopolymer transport system component